jgi:Peptidase S46
MRKAALALLLLATPLAADEGMWRFNRPPLQQLKDKHGFAPSPQWFEHLQKASPRFNSGGSGAFLSPDGLTITNHHVGIDCAAELATAERDLMAKGFRAKTRSEELPCHDFELNVLMSIEDVTARVNAAVKPSMSRADAEGARRAVMNDIEKESFQKTGLRSDVITLFQGGEYHLYHYKKYTDVRLVFAPEMAAAFFGGDPDNFEFPRFNLDIMFFRVYEDGKPAKTDHYLKFSPAGPRDGDLVLLAGNPGATERQKVVSELEFVRDLRIPFSLNTLRRREVLLNSYSKQSAENRRRAENPLSTVENSRKALLGQLNGIQDPVVIDAKRAAERALGERATEPLANIAKLIAKQRATHVERWFLSTGGAFWSDLFAKARMIVRYGDEAAKPNAERLREFNDAALDSVREAVLGEAPIHADLEALKLADSLSYWTENFPNDPLVKQVVAGKSPRQRAAELVSGTKVGSAAERKRLIEGGKAAIAASDDPMIRVARLVDPRARELRKAFEEEVEEPLRQEYARVADVRFRTSGTTTYPDATFTLRLSYGTVKGYSGSAGPHFPSMTTLGAAYERAAGHQNASPFNLPQSWLDAKPKVKLDTPYNFALTADIIGGSSGSPIVNRAGEFVGIVFDMDIPSLVYNFAYREEDARAMGVHSQAILETLRSIYGATELIDELTKR